MSSANDPNAFPEFRIDQIERYAKRWVKKYSVIQIERIILYNYDLGAAERSFSEDKELNPTQYINLEATKRFFSEYKKLKPTQYALVFEISGCTDIDLKKIALGTLPTTGDDKCTTALKEIQFANQPNLNPLFNLHPLFNSLFSKKVYKETPDTEYFRNWTYILRRPGDPWRRGLLLNEPLILFESECEEVKSEVQAKNGREKAVESTNNKEMNRVQSEESADPETLIKALQMLYLDKTEVKIRYKRKSAIFNGDSMGFRNSNTEEWKAFLEILEAKEHFYRLGPAYYFNKEIHKKVRKNEYDKRLKILQKINEKLISFLTKQYNIEFPPKFKLYELQPAEGKGVYSFKFQIPSDKLSYITKDTALSRLTMMIQNNASEFAISKATNDALEAGATKDELLEIVQDRLPSHPEYNGIPDEQEKEDEDDYEN